MRHAGRAAAVLASVLVHAAGLALIMATPRELPRTHMEIVDVALVTEVPAPPAATFGPDLSGPWPLRTSPDADASRDDAHARAWTPFAAMAPSLSQRAAVLYAGTMFRALAAPAAPDCVPGQVPARMQPACNVAQIAAHDPFGTAVVKGFLTPPTLPFSIDQAPVITEWDILLGQMLR